MSYLRPMGDPITDPSQVEDTIVGEVPPTRVQCATLPADSPWRRPGQVCEPSILDQIFDWLRTAGTAAPPTGTPTDASTPPSSSDTSSLTPILLLGGAAAAAYYLTRKKKPRHP